MLAVEIIRKKRSGQSLTRQEMKEFITGYLAGSVADYQMAAFLMAVYFRKMDFEETAAFTDIMIRSGQVVDLSSVPGIKVDKHSTGGVGDKVSLILAPMVAACGVPVPMISGRGLGHTGGTLDKLESIPGFRTDLSVDEYRSVLSATGVAMIGQTAEIAPADRRMYALRDVTGTVESIPLIAGSIMSKKIAAGIDALVLDIKTGRGAFMQSESDAIDLARTLVAIGERFGKRTVGFLTGMDQPLGFAVGNWLEVVECVDCMQGRDVGDLMDLTYTLGGAMVMAGGKASSPAEGAALCRRAVQEGRAFDKFVELAGRQGADVSFLRQLSAYPRSRHVGEITATRAGVVGAIDALEIGVTGILLGAGRARVEDRVEPKAGILLRKKVGDPVTQGDVLASLYTDRSEMVGPARERILKAYGIQDEIPVAQPLIRAMIDKDGVHRL